MIRETILSIPDRKRQLCLLAAAVIAGVLLYCKRGNVWPALFLTTGGGTIVILLLAKEKREAAISISLVAALFVFTIFHCMYDSRRYEAHLEMVEAQTECTVTGKLYKKEFKTNQYLYYLKDTKFGKIMVYTTDDSAKIGSVVTVSGELNQFSTARNDGNFDQSVYYRSMNIVCRMFADSVVCKKEGRGNFREALFVLQGRISTVFEKELNDRDAGILCTLVLGNKALLENEVRDLYQDAGISHILAISGLHISILGLGLFRFLRKLGCSYPIAAGIGSVAVVTFALMSGMAVSARRALVMFLLMMGAKVLGRVYDGVNALALAVTILLSIQPLALFQSGFQFSCVSLVGIQFSIALFENNEWNQTERATGDEKNRHDSFERKFRKKRMEFFAGLRSNLFSGAFLQLFLLPLTAWHYYEVPLYSIFLNLLVLPLCSWLLGFGLLGGVTGLMFPEISKWMLIVCHLILSFYENLIGVANRLPFSQIITGKPNAWLMLLYYAALVVFCLTVIARKNRMNLSLQAGERIASEDGKKSLRNFAKKIPVYGFFIFKNDRMLTKNEKSRAFLEKTLLAMVFGILSFLLLVPKPEKMQIDFLDVSQGDGIYIADGSGHHVMIDGGSTDEDEVGRYRIEPFLKYHGVRKIDAWIITHSDADHCSGALELLQGGYPVKRLLLAKAMPADDSRQSLIDAAKENGTEVIWVDAGDSLNLDRCSMTCLYPDATQDGAAESSENMMKTTENLLTGSDTGQAMACTGSDVDVNALSQVWIYRQEDFSVLFTGDIGADTESLLLEREILEDCTVLKVAHHGSKNSSSEEFLESISPEYAVISSGVDNSYGHPHAETLERLEVAGSEIFNTQDCGQITLRNLNGTWLLSHFLNDK